MVFFLYGGEDFLIRRKAKEIIGKYREKYQSGLSFDIFDFANNSEKTVWELKNFLQACSMFPEKKMAVLKNVLEADATAKKQLSGLLKEFKLVEEKNSFAVLTGGGELKKTDPLMELVRDQRVKKQKFEQLRGTKLKDWLFEEVESKGGEIESSAANILLLAIKDDLWRLSNELDKLLSYAPKITFRAVQELVVSGWESNIFETAEAIIGGEKKKAWELFYRHLNQGEDAGYVFSMVVRQARIFLLIAGLLKEKMNETLIIRKTGLHAFVVKKAIWQLKKIKRNSLEELYGLLARLEIEIKSGQIESETAIDLVIAEAGFRSNG